MQIRSKIEYTYIATTLRHWHIQHNHVKTLPNVPSKYFLKYASSMLLTGSTTSLANDRGKQYW